MIQAALEKLFEENYRNCPPFVLRYAGDPTRKWKVAKNPQGDNFFVKPMWTDGNFSYTWLELLAILVRKRAVCNDQSFENWLLSWAGGVPLDDSQVEELL